MSLTREASETLSVGQIARFWEVFSFFDKDGSGSISRAELGLALRAIDQKQSGEELQALIDEYDVNGDGGIDFEEFLRWGARALTDPGAENETREAFAFVDADNDGYITPDELKLAMVRLHFGLPEDALDALIQEVLADGAGRLTYVEFARVAMSTG